MARMLRGLVALCLVAAAAAQGVGAQPVIDRDSWRPSYENDPQAGVLCAWGIYTTLRQVGATCFPEDTAFRATLDDAVRRLDAFIIANMPTSPEVLEAARQETLRPFEAEGMPDRLCRSMDRPSHGALELYRHLRARGADTIRAEIDRLLATQRRPSMNPCL